jgi:osmotically-inducible protein OsmY
MKVREAMARTITSAMKNDRVRDIRMPEIKMPEFKMPEMTLPEFKMNGARAAKNVQSRMPKARRGPRAVSVLVGAIGGAVLFYFMDPERGVGRRAQAREQLIATFRRANRNIGQLGSRAGANANGFSQKMIHLRSGGAPVDDLTLRDRVESELFRDPSLPKGRINLDVESAIVTVRGELESAYQIASIEKAILKIRGVNGVENLLHVEGTPAPNKVEARESVR